MSATCNVHNCDKRPKWTTSQGSLYCTDHKSTFDWNFKEVSAVYEALLEAGIVGRKPL